MHFGIDPRHSPIVSAVTILRSTHHIRMPKLTNRPYLDINSYQSTPPKQITSRAAPAQISSDLERQYELIENMLHNLKNQPLHTAIEQTLMQMMNANSCTLWVDNPAANILTSATLSRQCKYKSAILGLSYREKKLINVLNPSKHDAFDVTVDPSEASCIYLPLLTEDNSVFAVAQIKRSFDWIPFSESDEPAAEFFANKFKQLSHLFLHNNSEDEFVNSISTKTENVPIITQLSTRLTHHFHCRVVEFWSYDSSNETYAKYENKGFIPIQANQTGAIGQALKDGENINTNNVTKYSGYSPNIDGSTPDSLLFSCIHAGSKVFGIALRGKGSNKSFSAVDLMQLTNMAPVIIRSLMNDDGSTDDPSFENSSFALRLKALLEVAEILSGVLDIDVLIPTIMARACSLLNTERCSLFLVDTTKQELITRFHGGLEKSIRLPINRGIVGHTATTGNVVNIIDAYEDPRFDKQVDILTGFKTRTILTVPIYNNRGEITGVTEMINRIDGSAFDAEDIKMMMAFNVFCGISLDNAKLYQTSLDLTRQLRGFVEMSSALNKTKTVRDVIEEILNNAMIVIHASRATVFLPDQETGILSPFVTIGEDIHHGITFANQVAETKKAALFSKEDMFQILKTDDLPSDSSEEKGRGLSRISSALSKDLPIYSSNKSASDLPQFEPICDFPLISNDSKLLGIMELTCSWKILPEDMKLLDTFAVFASVSIEKSELQEIAKFGHIEAELKKWIGGNERKECIIPARLVIAPDNTTTLFTNNFDAPAWVGIGYFKVLFHIFEHFNLFNEFKINSELFFRFISEISSTYNQVPYHNWRHACDVTQFVTYEIKTGHVDDKLTKFELFGLLVSAICHDANHDGFSNIFNVKAETPLGILFKNQSVMETHHCSVSIQVLSKEENNLFKSLTAADFKIMWTLIIQLILITDMAKHFDYLKEINALLDAGPLDLTDQHQRLLMMQGLLKCGDISNVSRPFELADKWCDVLCEEFFRQGDLEMASGMEYTSPLNDREHLDKPKSQIGFYTFVCLPLFQGVTRLVPELQCNVDQVQSNLAVWKAAAAEKAKLEEEEKARQEAEKAKEEGTEEAKKEE